MADKLTQDEVLRLMSAGWSCAQRHHEGYWTLQKGERGHGGETKNPHGQTMNALLRRKLIVPLPYKMATFETRYVVATPASNNKNKDG